MGTQANPYTIPLVPTEDKYDAVMMCPNCGNNWTHHVATTVNARLVEDGDTISTLATADGRVTRSIGTQNPSGRRDSVVMQFDCENGCEFALEFTQHKGETFTVYHIFKGLNE